jgi:hypothetical protein
LVPLATDLRWPRIVREANIECERCGQSSAGVFFNKLNCRKQSPNSLTTLLDMIKLRFGP